MDATLSEKTSLAGLAGKYLPFLPGIKSYGISVLKVRETMLYTNTTVAPHMPDCIKGVINLRGKIIPVIDLRLKFGMPGTDATEHSCIVVVQVARTNNTKLTMGIVVDGVEEVAKKEHNIRDPPIHWNLYRLLSRQSRMVCDKTSNS